MPKTRSNNSQVITFDSEAELQFALNQATLPDRWNVLAKGGKFTAVGTGGGQFISPEAEEVLANMPTPLAGAERDAVINFLNSQSDSLGSGNWSLVDAFAHGKLSDNTNKLWKWKANGAMTNNGAVLGVDGWEFSPVGNTFIDTNYNALIDGVNYQLNNAIVGVFVVEFTPNINIYLMGNSESTGSRCEIWDLSGGNVRGFINSTGAYSLLGRGVAGNSLYSLIRTAVNEGGLYENGVKASLDASNSSEIPNATFLLGRKQLPVSSMTGVLSSFVAGGGVGFDQPNFYNNLAILNDAL